MKKNSNLKIFGVIVFILFLFFLIKLAEGYAALQADYARITDVEYKAVLVDEVNSQGKVIITERLTFDIHAASELNPFWELWRELPEEYVDGLKNSYKVNSVKEILDDGTEVEYTESPKLYWNDSDYISTQYGPGKWYYDSNDECVLFYINGVYRDELVFEIEYEMTNTVFKYNDSSELYLTMYSESTIKHLNSYKGQILIPYKDMPSSGNYEVYTYGTDADSFDYLESDTLNPGYHTFYFDLDSDDLQFSNYNQFLEFTLIAYGSDRHKFADYASDNYYTYDDALDELREEYTDYIDEVNGYRLKKKITFITCIGISILVLWYSFTFDKRMKKKHVFYTPTIKESLGSYNFIPSNLDPNFAATLIFCKDPKEKDLEDGFAAIMLSLVRKGYIEIVKINESYDWNIDNIKIVIKYQPIGINNSNAMLPPGQTAITEQANNMQLVKEPSLKQVMSRINPMYTNSINTTYTYNTDTTRLMTMPETIENTVSEIEIPKEYKSLEALTLLEEHYFNLILRHSNGIEVSMASFQNSIEIDYENTSTFMEKMEDAITNIGVSQGYFQKAAFKKPMRDTKALATFCLVIGIMLLTIVNLLSCTSYLGFAFGGYTILGIVLIICAYYLNKNAKNYVLLTQYGEDEYVKWRGFYNFLNNDIAIKESTLNNVATLEQYLIYATAFGISNKIVDVLNVKYPVIENSRILNNRYYRSRRFYHHHRNFRTSAHRASYAARSGGYSSGGRGGGGGGGGH